MRTFTQRFLGTIAAILIAAAWGAWIGDQTGHHVALRHATVELDQYAIQIRDELEKSSAQSRSVLAKLNASTFPHCSDREIAYFRDLIYASEFLKDGGRMRDGRIECSATLGRLRPSAEQYQPLVTLSDGVRLYRDLPPLRVAGQTVVAVQLGDAYTVYDPYNLTSLRRSSMHYALFDRDLSSGQARHLVVGAPDSPASLATDDRTWRDAQTLFATRCSQHYSFCISAYSSFDEALNAQHGEMRAYLVLSGLCGALFGLACSTLYRRNQAIEHQLRRAIRRNELSLVYQPLFDLTTGQIKGAEALARWTDEDGYVVSPEVFITIAEERGFVGEITRAVVHSALHDLKAILQARPGFRINVNITAADLTDLSFMPMLQKALEAEGIAAQSLGIEITESSTARGEDARQAILQLRNQGHSVHIDDFGTGYSNLAYLHDLSVDFIKIDRAFTQSIGTDSVKVSILPQIFSMVQTLNLQVVVEGIETEEQARYFSAMQPHVCAQGWLLSRPVPLDELLRLLREDVAAQPARSA